MTEKEIVKAEGKGSAGFIQPVATLDDFRGRYELTKQFVEDVLKEGVDYGKIPGTGEDAKPTLLKPGAEKVTTLFGIKPIIPIDEKVEDWDGSDHEIEGQPYPFFYYRHRAEMYYGDELIGTAYGSCNSWEKKYLWRTAQRRCPDCGKETIIKGKEEYGGGWVCWKKKDGCGASFADDDSRIVSQEVGRVLNPDPYDLPNTILKMSHKRALVAGALLVGNVSDYFTQDLEDLDYGVTVEGNFKTTDDNGSGDSDADENQLHDEIVNGLSEEQAAGIKRFQQDMPEHFPKHKTDWQTAYGYLEGVDDMNKTDLKDIVNGPAYETTGEKNVQLGLAILLGYVDPVE